MSYEGVPELRFWQRVSYLEPRDWPQPGTQAVGLQAWLPLRCWLAPPWGIETRVWDGLLLYIGESWSSVLKPAENSPSWAFVSLVGNNPHVRPGLNCLRNPWWALYWGERG